MIFMRQKVDEKPVQSKRIIVQSERDDVPQIVVKIDGETFVDFYGLIADKKESWFKIWWQMLFIFKVYQNKMYLYNDKLILIPLDLTMRTAMATSKHNGLVRLSKAMEAFMVDNPKVAYLDNCKATDFVTYWYNQYFSTKHEYETIEKMFFNGEKVVRVYLTPTILGHLFVKLIKAMDI